MTRGSGKGGGLMNKPIPVKAKSDLKKSFGASRRYKGESMFVSH